MSATTPFQSADAIARARQGVGTFEPGRSYARVRCVVRGARVGETKAGKPYLSLTLGDRTGEVEAKCWEGAALLPKFMPGTVVEIARLDRDDYGAKFEPRDAAVLAPGAYEPSEFVPSLPIELIEQHWARLHEYLDSIENPDLQRLREAVFADAEVAAKYKTHPSATNHHHNYLGGNVEHVVGIMRVVDAVCAGYGEIDRDVVLFGAAVHDLGKLREYAVETTILYTDEGRLRGHLVIGAEWLGQICQRMRGEPAGFPRGLEDHLVHMILSHHRKGEWGSPKPPATPEAMLLHLADYADSQTKGFLQEVERGRDAPDGWARRWDSDAGANLWMRTARGWD